MTADLPAGPELDRLIAEKVMGWKRVQDGNDVEAYGAPIFAWYENGARRAWDTAWYHHERWSPSTNIANAWEVIEKLPRTRGDATFCVDRLGDGSWVAGYREQWDGYEPHAFANADTAPLAICRAAL